MMAGTPQLSVVIPAFNAASHLDEAIASVVAEVEGRAEIIVVDDGSSDDTAAIADAHGDSGVSCIRRHRQGGAGAARNQGVAAARGRYLAFLDADDRWTTGRLRALEAALHAADAARIAFGHMRQFLCPRMDSQARRRLHCPAQPMPGYCAGAMLMHREDFQRVGPFEEDLKVGEFIGWFARARDLGLATVMIEDVVLERRIHGANQTIRHRADQADYLHAVKRALDRRRQG
jgi:glycosyltransferase involved in cell wall biosynthesis